MRFYILKNLKGIATFLLVITLFSSPLFGKNQPIQIVTSTGYPPFYYAENGILKGICIDVIENVFKQLDIEISYKQVSWKQMIFSAKKGRTDAVMPLFKNKAREKFLYFHENRIAIESNQIFAHKDSHIDSFKGYGSLSLYSVGVISGYSYGDDFDNQTSITKVNLPREIDILRMVIKKRITLGIGNRNVLLYHAQLHKIPKDELLFLKPNITEAPLYIGFSKKREHRELSKNFSNTLKQFKTSKTYKNILKKYDFNSQL